MYYRNFCARAGRVRARLRQNVGARFVSRWTRNRKVHSHFSCRVCQRKRYIVSVAHIHQVQTLQLSLRFLQRHQVGNRLARMQQIRQRIDNWNTRRKRQFFQQFLRKRPYDQHVHPARQIPPHILHAFSLPQSNIPGSQIHRVPSHLLESHLKRHPCAQRRLFKNQRRHFSLQRHGVRFRMRLHLFAQMQQRLHFRNGDVVQR